MLRYLFVAACILLGFPLLAPGGRSQTGGRDSDGDPLPEGALVRLGSIRWRHDGGIAFADFAPDGKTVISVSRAGTLFVWEFPSGKVLHRFAPPAEVLGANLASLTPDRKTIAIACWLAKDKPNRPAILIRDVAGGQELARLELESGNVRELAFTMEGKHLTGQDSSGAGRIWDWASGKEIAKFRSYQPTAQRLDYHRFSPDGKTLLLFDVGTAPKFVDLATGKELVKDSDLMVPYVSLWFTPDGSHFITRTSGAAFKWDAANNKLEGPILKMAENGKGTFISPDGLVSLPLGSSWFTDHRVADVNNPKGIAKKGAAKGKAKAAGPAGLTPAGRLNLIDLASGKTLSTIDLQDQPLYNVPLFSPDNRVLALPRLYEEEHIDLVDRETGNLLHSLMLPEEVANSYLTPNNAWMPTMLFSPDGRLLAKLQNNNAAAIALFDVKTGKQAGLLKLKVPNDQESALSRSTLLQGAFSPDGKCLAVVDLDQVTVYDLAAGKPIRTLATQAFLGLSIGSLTNMRGPLVAFSPDGKLLAVAGIQDDTVHLWEIETGKKLHSFKGHKNGVAAVAFSPSGQSLYSASWDTTILIWNIQAKQLVEKGVRHCSVENPQLTTATGCYK